MMTDKINTAIALLARLESAQLFVDSNNPQQVAATVAFLETLESLGTTKVETVTKPEQKNTTVSLQSNADAYGIHPVVVAFEKRFKDLYKDSFYDAPRLTKILTDFETNGLTKDQKAVVNAPLNLPLITQPLSKEQHTALQNQLEAIWSTRSQFWQVQESLVEKYALAHDVVLPLVNNVLRGKAFTPHPELRSVHPGDMTIELYKEYLPRRYIQAVEHHIQNPDSVASTSPKNFLHACMLLDNEHMLEPLHMLVRLKLNSQQKHTSENVFEHLVIFKSVMDYLNTQSKNPEFQPLYDALNKGRQRYPALHMMPSP